MSSPFSHLIQALYPCDRSGLTLHGHSKSACTPHSYSSLVCDVMMRQDKLLRGINLEACGGATPLIAKKNTVCVHSKMCKLYVYTAKRTRMLP